jgi:hypothetical protein
MGADDPLGGVEVHHAAEDPGPVRRASTEAWEKPESSEKGAKKTWRLGIMPKVTCGS